MVEMNVPDVRAGVELDSAFASPCAVLAAGQKACVLLDKQMSWRIRDCCHRPDSKSPICSLTWRLCLYYLSICVFSCPGISWKWVLAIEMSEPPQGHFALGAGTLHCHSQLGTSQAFVKLCGGKHRITELRVFTQQDLDMPVKLELRGILKTLLNTYILSLYLNSLSFMSEASWPPRRFAEFESCLSCVGCTDLTHITRYKASKILTCNKLFISTESVSRLQHSQRDLEGYNIDLKMHGWFSLSCDSNDG